MTLDELNKKLRELPRGQTFIVKTADLAEMDVPGILATEHTKWAEWDCRAIALSIPDRRMSRHAQYFVHPVKLGRLSRT